MLLSSKLEAPQSTKQTAIRRVALGMSGGVDSSLCAHLLIEQGYEVTGVFLECWRAPGCRSEEDRKDALRVALDLGIAFEVLDFKDAYRQKVVEYFFAEYQAGRTPNPDVMCNKEIKFGLFYDWAMANGFDAIATGHYARIGRDQATEKPFLLSAVDEHKDQTYFLYRLDQDQLNHILFPVGQLTKSQVRAEAKERGLHVANKKDSVGICFIGDIDVHAFLRERLGENPGNVVDVHGNVIGQHQGLWFYTVGQRHGFTIQSVTSIRQSNGSLVDKHNIPPFYVIRKNPEQNELVVGFGEETLQESFALNDRHWIDPNTNEEDLMDKPHLFVRIRHTGQLWPCVLKKLPSGSLAVQLATPIQGLAEGQSGVVYQARERDFECLGGGIITIPTEL
jgi:tRNA-specific 2-thiouridylase